MSKAKLFQRSFKSAMTDAERRVDEIRINLDATLETLAVRTFGVPDPAKETLFAPPPVPVRVVCWHCGKRYLSNKMRLEYRPRLQATAIEMMAEGAIFDELTPLWWCKDPECDGGGFGHDLHEVKAKARA